MESKLTSTVKKFFNILRKDKEQICNEHALYEIINLFVFYMLDSNIKYEKSDDDSLNTIYDLNISENDIDMKIFNDKLNELISDDKNIKNTTWNKTDLKPYLKYLQYGNFKKLYNIKNNFNNTNGNEEDFKGLCKQNKLDYYNFMYYLDNLNIYRLIMRIFNSHKYFKYIIDTSHNQFVLLTTLDKLIEKVEKFNNYKQNKNYDFFGALYESLYDDYFYG